MKRYQKIILSIVFVFAIGYLIPERIRIPVMHATPADWNQQSFWYEPWGSSGVHKGIDIFAALGTGVTSTTDGLVIYTGQHAKGGRVIVVLGPKWRFHYFAHLNTIDTSMFSFVQSGDHIATLGDSGNAQGKQPHLHYSIVRLIPAPWAMDSSTQGYKKAFYIDPNAYLGG
jgi:peptidoglycan LD-endopeptidase LytH